MIAQKLGNEDAALYRFTHPAAQPTPSATPLPALSNTVVERDPSLHPSQRASGLHKPTSHASAQQAGSKQQADSQQASKSSSHIPSQGGVGAGTRERSKAGLQYAVGNAKVPIMLAEIKVCLHSPAVLSAKLAALLCIAQACRDINQQMFESVRQEPLF